MFAGPFKHKFSIELTRYMPRKKVVKEKNLLSSNEDETVDEEEEIDVGFAFKESLCFI